MESHTGSEDALLSRFPFRSLLNALTASSLLSGPHQAEFISSVQKLEINLCSLGVRFLVCSARTLWISNGVSNPVTNKNLFIQNMWGQGSLRRCIWWIYLLEFGPAILVSRSWICLTSREMCCRRSLFCSSSWWTRAWASSRAVASALSWSFNRWTCRWGHIYRWTDKWRRGRSWRSARLFQTLSPRSQPRRRLARLPPDQLCDPNTVMNRFGKNNVSVGWGVGCEYYRCTTHVCTTHVSYFAAARINCPILLLLLPT